MLRLLGVALALLWCACVFLQSVPAELASKGRDTTPPLTSSPAKPAPRGLEWRKVRRFGRRIVAVRLQVLVA